MAIKTSNGRYHSGVSAEPDEPLMLGDELTGVRPGGYGRWMYCKYCYKNVRPVASYEDVEPVGETRQALCSECGAGLTPCEPVDGSPMPTASRSEGLLDPQLLLETHSPEK
jgi:hypothetical protein